MNAVQSGDGVNSSHLKAWLFLGGLGLLVGFTGGASRYDAIQIVPLRTLSGLMLLPAIYFLSLTELRKERVLLTLLGALILLIAVQLVPLPNSIWQILPGREAVDRLDESFGLRELWRPMTLAPMRTWNALGSLVVPAAGLLLAVSLARSAHILLHLIAGLGVMNAFLGLVQVAGGHFSPFYFYEVTNRGGVVGIFANENHAGIFAACSMLVVAHLGINARVAKGANWMRLIYPAAFVLIFLTALVGGSRAGFTAAIGALLLTFGMVVLAPMVRGGRSVADPIRRWIDGHPRLVTAIPLVALLLIVVLFVTLGRASAFSDLVGRDSFDDLRWSLWPVTVDMAQEHWLIGSGFGSFEQVYRMHEPAELLMSRYVNQAHNDWAQLLIEGGVVAAALLVTIVMWIAKAVGNLAAARQTRSNALFWFGVFVIIGGASLIDYPLRTPLFQLVCVWLLVALSRDYRDYKAT